MRAAPDALSRVCATSDPDQQADPRAADEHADTTPYPGLSDLLSEVRKLKSLRHSPFSEECLFSIATIIQHEAGSFATSEVWNFMADQLTYDAAQLGCRNLTRVRWPIKSRPRPIPAILLAAHRWPRVYPKCQFVGMPGDLIVWRYYGYATRVDYTFTDGRFTIVGVNCGTRTPVPIVKELKQLKHDFDN